MLELLLIETKEYIKGEFQAIKDTVLEIKKGNFGDLFTMGEGRHFHRTVLAYVNQMFQQISGMLDLNCTPFMEYFLEYWCPRSSMTIVIHPRSKYVLA